MRMTTFLAATLLAFGAAHADPAQWRAEWPQTDFSRTIVGFSEIISGGPPKDGIPAIWEPVFVDAATKQDMDPREPVLIYQPRSGPARAYPLRYLMWHEIVNDVVDELPIAVTYCPLCNSAMVFKARIDGVRHMFGVSGKLRHSDMIMYDRETHSWWQQAVGQGIVGEYAGMQLKQLPAWMQDWASFRAEHPEGLVMATPDWPRAYGTNPYVSYDTSPTPFLYQGENPPHGIHPLERVVRVGERAWTFARLRSEGDIHEAGVVLSWREGQASVLDTRDIATGRDVGTVRVRDAEGRDVAHDVPFAFAFHAFFPDGLWMLGQ